MGNNRIFWENAQYKIGEDKRIRFWLDNWETDQTLKKSFPHLYQIAPEDGSINSQSQGGRGGGIEWNLQLRRTLLIQNEGRCGNCSKF